jgi:hypothetical protein
MNSMLQRLLGVKKGESNGKLENFSCEWLLATDLRMASVRMILAQELQSGPFEGPLQDQRCTVDAVVVECLV